MGRLFFVFIASALFFVPCGPVKPPLAQPVFFSMLFPQLIPDSLQGLLLPPETEEATVL